METIQALFRRRRWFLLVQLSTKIELGSDKIFFILAKQSSPQLVDNSTGSTTPFPCIVK
jgi:hypothetical protein